MAKLWGKVCDFASRWIQPLMSAAAVVSGVLVTYDFSEERASFPKWPGLFDLLEGSLLFWLFIVAASLSCLISLALSFREKTMGELRETINKHQSEINEIGNNIINVFDGLLLNLGQKLGLEQSDQVRISLYIHDSDNSRFLPCGRYSPNPTYSGPGRTSYPADQGCIFEGWKNDWHFDNSIPAIGAPRRNYNKTTYKIPDETNTKIRMSSRLYAVKRLDDVLGNSIAVLVVEALEPNRFDSEYLRTALAGVADDYSKMVYTLRSYIPDPSKAAESGL